MGGRDSSCGDASKNLKKKGQLSSVFRTSPFIPCVTYFHTVMAGSRNHYSCSTVGVYPGVLELDLGAKRFHVKSQCFSFSASGSTFVGVYIQNCRDIYQNEAELPFQCRRHMTKRLRVEMSKIFQLAQKNTYIADKTRSVKLHANAFADLSCSGVLTRRGRGTGDILVALQ